RFRLFLCAGCRALWDRLPDPETRRAVEVAERFADGEAFGEELADARQGAEELGERLREQIREADESSANHREYEAYWRLSARADGAFGAAHAADEPGTYFSTGIYEGSTIFEHTRLYGGHFALHQALTHEDPEEDPCPELDALWADLSEGMNHPMPFDPAWRT